MKLDYGPVYWEYERGWVTSESDEELAFWEPLPISLARFVMDPRSERAGNMMLVQIGLLSGMNLFTYAMSRQGYKTMTGILIEAATGYSTGQLAAAAAPIAASVAGAVAYEKYVNQPLREAHGGAGGNVWFGPFASGFGSVV